MVGPWKDFPTAKKWYSRILRDCGFSQEADLNARDLLYLYRQQFDPTLLVATLQKQILKKQPLFFGAGPNLFRHLMQIATGIKKNRNHYFLVAADGSANAFSIFNLIPDLIVTDLDGLTLEEIQQFLIQGAIVMIHGHGDNIDLLTSSANLIQTEPNVICTTQTEPKFPIINSGGFTDGDRGIYFLHHLLSIKREFWLFGYEFEDSVGPYSKHEYSVACIMHPLKKIKMHFAKLLISDLHKTYNRPIHFYGQNPIDDLRMKHSILHSL